MTQYSMRQHLHCMSFTTGVLQQFGVICHIVFHCKFLCSWSSSPLLYLNNGINYSFTITYISYLLHIGQMIFTETYILI